MGLQDFLNKKNKTKDAVREKEAEAAVIRNKNPQKPENAKTSVVDDDLKKGKISGFLKKIKNSGKLDNPVGDDDKAPTVRGKNYSKEEIEQIPGVERRDVTLGTKPAIVSGGASANDTVKVEPTQSSFSEEKILSALSDIDKRLEKIESDFAEKCKEVNESLSDVVDKVSRQVSHNFEKIKSQEKEIEDLNSNLRTLITTVKSKADIFLDVLSKSVEKDSTKYVPEKVEPTSEEQPVEEEEEEEYDEEEYDEEVAEGSSEEETSSSDSQPSELDVKSTIIEYVKKKKPTRKSDILEDVSTELECTQLDVSDFLTELMEDGYIGKDGRTYIIAQKGGADAVSSSEEGDPTEFPEDVDLEELARAVYNLAEGLEAEIETDSFITRALNLLGGEFRGVSKANFSFLVSEDGLNLDDGGVIYPVVVEE